MIHTVTIDNVLRSAALKAVPIIDIRSPKEYTKGHIPGAVSLPLFDDVERSIIGTTYHKVGKQAAILQGFEIAGPKWSEIIKAAKIISPELKVVLHCWRGGMRSEAVAWALNLYGFEVYLIKGGYKSFRRWAHNVFEGPLQLVVLAGKTGSNKTGLLSDLGQRGEQIIDLEALACHQGSAYGSKGFLVQPSQESFENQLAWHISNLDTSKRIWIEDESITIGKLAIPTALWQQLLVAPEIELKQPLSKRLALLDNEYGILDKQFLEEATLKIKKRLGLELTREAITAIHAGEMQSFISIVLKYYDKAYAKSRKDPQLKPWVDKLDLSDASQEPAIAVIQLAEKNKALKLGT